MLGTVLAALTSCALQEPADAAGAATVAPVTIEARDRTGALLTNAAVVLEFDGAQGPTRVHLKTDRDGTATLPTQARGARFRAVDLEPGHASSIHGAVDGRPIASDRIVVVASPPSGVDVRLTGSGAPDGALLVLVTPDWQPHEAPDAVAPLISGENRVDAPPGIYLVMLHSPGAPVLTAMRDARSPMLVRVPPGGRGRLTLDVPATEPHSFRLVDAFTGEPIGGAQLWPRTLGRGAADSYRWSTDPEGRFPLRLPPPFEGRRGVAAISVYFGWATKEQEGSAGWVPPAPTLRAMAPQVAGELAVGALARERDVHRIELSRGADAAWEPAEETVSLAVPGLTRVALRGRGDDPVDVTVDLGVKQPGEVFALESLIERRTMTLDFGEEESPAELDLAVSSPRASGTLHRVTTSRRIHTAGRVELDVWVPVGAQDVVLEFVGRGAGGAVLWARIPARARSTTVLDRTTLHLRRRDGAPAAFASLEIPEPGGAPLRAIADEAGELVLWSDGASALLVSTDLETHPPTRVATGAADPVVVPVAGERTALSLVARGVGETAWWAEVVAGSDGASIPAACFLDESGRLEIAYLPPGPYRVRVRREDGSAGTEWTKFELETSLVVEFDVTAAR